MTKHDFFMQFDRTRILDRIALYQKLKMTSNLLVHVHTPELWFSVRLYKCTISWCRPLSTGFSGAPVFFFVHNLGHFLIYYFFCTFLSQNRILYWFCTLTYFLLLKRTGDSKKVTLFLSLKWCNLSGKRFVYILSTIDCLYCLLVNYMWFVCVVISL